MTPSSIASPRLLALASLGLLLVAAAGQAARAADAGQGALVFRRCAACHEVDEPINRVGPHLMGVVGRTAGTVPGSTRRRSRPPGSSGPRPTSTAGWRTRRTSSPATAWRSRASTMPTPAPT